MDPEVAYLLALSPSAEKGPELYVHAFAMGEWYKYQKYLVTGIAKGQVGYTSEGNPIL